MKSSYLIASVIAIIATVWIISGVIFSDQEQAHEKTGEEQAPQNQEQEARSEVRVRDIEAQMIADNIALTGRSQASRIVDLKAETVGQIVSLQKEKGAPVAKGDIIAKIEIKDRQARVEEAAQLVNQRDIQYKAAKALEGQGFNSRVRLAESLAQLEAAKTDLKQARIDLAKTSIKAPFDGVVSAQFIEAGDFVNTGQNIVTLVDLDPIEITAFVSERQVIKLQDGSKANVTFLNGQTIEGEVTYIAPTADEETRTFEIEITSPNEDYSIKQGWTADVNIPARQQKAYKISPSILSLRDDGAVGIKIVDEENRVVFHDVDIIRDKPGFLWISAENLPDNPRIITVGQEFVIEGEEVTPVLSEGDGLL